MCIRDSPRPCRWRPRKPARSGARHSAGPPMFCTVFPPGGCSDIRFCGQAWKLSLIHIFAYAQKLIAENEIGKHHKPGHDSAHPQNTIDPRTPGGIMDVEMLSPQFCGLCSNKSATESLSASLMLLYTFLQTSQVHPCSGPLAQLRCV